MSEHIWAFDWTRTSLGPRSSWSIELRNALAICLASRHPSALFWGDDFALLYNDAWSEVFGEDHLEALGRSGRLQTHIWDVFGSTLEAVRTSGVAASSDDRPLSLRRDGHIEERYFSSSLVPVRDGSGAVRGIVTALTETTWRIVGERRRTAMDESLAVLAHELRNPLAPIALGVHMMRRKLERGADTRHLDIIERQCRNLTRIADDLLDVSRLTRGKIELHREDVDLTEPVARALESSRPLIDGRRHTLTVATPAGPVLVYADPARVEQVIVNLVTNAAKYTEPGGQIHLAFEAQGGSAVLRVSDDGIGISPELRPRLFHLFEQGGRDITGTPNALGIGLTLVRVLVEMHDGSVDVESDGVGRGSTFTIRLPLANRASPTRASSDPASPVRVTEGRRSLRILVVDDDKDAADALRDLIADGGHDVRVAADGPSALEVNARWAPQLVFLDVGLPGMDGYAVAERLRRSDVRPTRLVALTGHGKASDQARSKAAGIDDHLVKPPRIATLTRILEEVAQGYQRP